MAGTKIFQVIGFQNSGKTSLIESIIKACCGENITVGTIKHHGHGGKPTRVVSNKDTDKHRSAGAAVTAVEGGGSLFIEADRLSWGLEEILDLYKAMKLDLIVVEGYKGHDFPKIVMLRDKEDEVLLTETTNIMAVISHHPLTRTTTIPVFKLNETDAFLRWFIRHYLER